MKKFFTKEHFTFFETLCICVFSQIAYCMLRNAESGEDLMEVFILVLSAGFINFIVSIAVDNFFYDE